jgi:hypothetical protein
MLNIAGGTYHEHCLSPHWQEFYGSGLRAAAATCRLSDSVSLSTYVPNAMTELAEALSVAFAVRLNVTQSDQSVRFEYSHGLSIPMIQPDPCVVRKQAPIPLDAKNVLRFGFVEGDAVITAENAVYDPQSAYDPRPFGENGSTAKRLAVVLNGREVSMLSGERDAEQGARSILAAEKAEAVVVKQGSRGALVVAEAGVERVPAYRTDRVWPIGSGDVFAAVFAHYWAERDLKAADAANLASLAAAYYCGSRTLPIPYGYQDSYRPPALSLRPRDQIGEKQVYLAGPFFTTAQLWLVDEARTALLDQGVLVFSPYHDVGRGPASHVVLADLKGLDTAAVVLAVLDGLDAGTLFEIGYARSRGIPVIAFVQNEKEEDLKMLEGTDCELVDDFVSAVYRAVWRATGV